MIAVRYATVPAARVINLTSPRCPSEVVQNWRGKNDWHDVRYEPLRDLIERTNVEAFDAANGHDKRLEASVLRAAPWAAIAAAFL